MQRPRPCLTPRECGDEVIKTVLCGPVLEQPRAAIRSDGNGPHRDDTHRWVSPPSCRLVESSVRVFSGSEVEPTNASLRVRVLLVAKVFRLEHDLRCRRFSIVGDVKELPHLREEHLLPSPSRCACRSTRKGATNHALRLRDRCPLPLNLPCQAFVQGCPRTPAEVSVKLPDVRPGEKLLPLCVVGGVQCLPSGP